jgi:hypothetical protein
MVETMRRIGAGIFLLSLVGALSLWPQSIPGAETSGSKMVSDLSAEVSRTSRESRDWEAQELPKQCVGYEESDMARPLLDPDSFIAIVTVTGVKSADADGPPSNFLDLRVEQFLRGSSNQGELHDEPLYAGDARVFCGGGFAEAGYYFSEPKVGDRYVIGYSFLGTEPGRAVISGAINLADHDKVQEMVDVGRFLDIEGIAGSSDFTPFVNALSDRVPWIRDLAVQRLVQSKACNNSPSCRQTFLGATRSLLSSSKVADRIEALHWTRLLTRPMAGDRNEWGFNGVARSNGLALMSTDKVRDMLRLAVSDPNLRISDEAYAQLQFFDFFNSASPGKCIVIFPTLRKSVRLPAGELKGITISGDLDCTPE